MVEMGCSSSNIRRKTIRVELETLAMPLIVLSIGIEGGLIMGIRRPEVVILIEERCREGLVIFAKR